MGFVPNEPAHPTLDLPFVCFVQQTVYQAGRVEGVLRLDVPAVNLGYDQIHAGGAGIDPGNVASSLQGPEKIGFAGAPPPYRRESYMKYFHGEASP